MEIGGGGQKELFIPPNILEGNGVGGQKELFILPPNILEGNGVVFGNFTLNNLHL